MNKTVLITGGSGLVGSALSTALLQKGYSVIILTRNITGKKSLQNLNYAGWDVKKRTIDIEAIQNADYIVHLAGAGVVDKKWTDSYKKEIVESRTQSSCLIFDSLKNNTNKVRAVISSSAIGFYGSDSNNNEAFTEAQNADESFLGTTCKLWEESIKPVTNLGKRLVILRSGIVLCNKGGALTEFKKPIRYGVSPILGNGKQIVSWIHIDDLCNMYIDAIENTKTEGVYNAVSPMPINNKKLMLSLAKLLKGRFFIPLHIPSFILKIIMGQRSIEVLKSTNVSCKKSLDAGFTFQYIQIESALENLVKPTNQH